jgi:methyl-accepting chemotaxis protein
VRFLPRKKLLVEPKIQRALLARCAVYWFLFALAVIQLTLSWQIAKGPDGPFFSHFDFVKLWQENSVVAIAGLLMLPVVLLDTAFISNRIVGPLGRVRNAIYQLGAGETIKTIEFRKNDYFKDMANGLNAVSARMQALEDRIRELESAKAGSHEEPVASHS